MAEAALIAAIQNAKAARKIFTTHEEVEKEIFKSCSNKLRTSSISKVVCSESGATRYSYLRSEHLLLWEKYLQCEQMPIVIVGPNSSGKSTFINTVLDHRVLGVGEGSVTKRIVRITYAPVEDARLEVYSTFQEGVRARKRKQNGHIKLSENGELFLPSKLKEEISKYLTPESAPVMEVESETLLSADTSSSRDGSSAEEMEVRCKIDEKTKKWYTQMVVIFIPSDFLKNGVDVYDTPGPDLENDADIEILKENCQKLLKQLVPFSVVVFLVPNPSAPPDVRVTHDIIMEAIGTVKERQPGMYFINNKYDVDSLINDSVLPNHLNPEDEGYADKIVKELEKLRRKSLNIFRKALKSPFLSSGPPDGDPEDAGEPYDIVDMIDEDEGMEQVRKKVLQRLLSICARHMETLTSMLLKGLCSAVEEFYSQIEFAHGYDVTSIYEIQQAMDRFETKLNNAFKAKFGEVLKGFPSEMAAILSKERQAILQYFRDHPISTENRRLCGNYRASHKEIADKLTALVTDRVARQAGPFLESRIGSSIEQILRQELNTLKLKEKHGEIMTEILDIGKLRDALLVTNPSVGANVGSLLLGATSTAVGIVVRIVVVDAVAAATTAALSVALAAVGGVVLVGGIIYYIYKATRIISSDRVQDWVRKKLDEMEKKYREMKPCDILNVVMKNVQEKIINRMQQSMVTFTNMESMKAEIPALKAILRNHQTSMDSTYFESRMILDARMEVDINQRLDAGGAGLVHDGVLKMGNASLDVAVKTPGIGDVHGTELHHEAMMLNLLEKWKIGRVVEFHCVTRVSVNGEVVPAIVMQRLDGDLNNLLCSSPRQPFPKIVRMAIQIGEALHSLHKKSLLYNDLKTKNILVDKDCNCFVADFGNSAVGASAQSRGGTQPLPPEIEESDGYIESSADIWAFGVVLYELFPKDVYARPSTSEELIQAALVLANQEHTGENEKQYVDVMLACLSPYPEKRPCVSAILGELHMCNS